MLRVTCALVMLRLLSVFAEDNVSTPFGGFHFSDLEADHQGGGGCSCQSISRDLEIVCQCRGRVVTDFPRNLTRGVTRLSLVSVPLKALKAGVLQTYKNSLKDLFLDSVKDLTEIEEGAFHDLYHLRTISIKQAPLLKKIADGVFRCFLPSLKILRIMQSALEAVPNLQHLETKNIIYMVDLDSNRINVLPKESVKIKTEIMNLDYNLIKEIHDWAFDGSQIAKLSLKGNRYLRIIEDNAFAGLRNIRKIDLSETSISSLPVKGLEELEVLKLINVYPLKVFPSVYHFKHIQEAHLTYPYHCCAFKFPASHDPEEFSRYKSFKEDMERKFCQDITTPSSADLSRTGTEVHDSPETNVFGFAGRRLKQISRTLYNHIRHLKWPRKWTRSAASGTTEWGGIVVTERSPVGGNEFVYFTYSTVEDDTATLVWKDLDDRFSDDWTSETATLERHNVERPVEGVFHRTTISLSSQIEIQAFCGRLAKNYRDVKCQPSPDAFNPCEDVMGNMCLRIAVWFVVITAVLGNVAVMVVLMSTGIAISVSKFLMCNLAFADFCMGFYLLMIAAMDVHSVGSYFNHAIDWQHGMGCRIAGFLTVFATELSIFTLTVISVERWYAITYAINLHKRLNMSTAVKIMACGWTYAVTMATLPLAEVNGYTRTSICLPMENKDGRDVFYLVVLFVTNSFAFFFIFFCYGKMYASVIRHQSKATASDMSVAKRMAMLVITDFVCWVPIAFFGLTAIAGYPLIDVTESKILLVFFYPLNSCANPFLYAILTMQYRRDFIMLVRRYGCCKTWARKHDDTVSCNVPQQPLSGARNYRSSVSSQISFDNCKILRPSDLKFEIINSGLDDPFDNPTVGMDDVIQLWSAKKDQEQLSTASDDSEQWCKYNNTPMHKGSPHPLKNRSIHFDIPIAKDEETKKDDITHV